MASHDDIDQLFRQIGGVPEGYREFGAPASKTVVATASEAAATSAPQPAQADLPSLSAVEAAAPIPIPVPVATPAAASSLPASATPLASLFDRLARTAGPSRAQGAH